MRIGGEERGLGLGWEGVRRRGEGVDRRGDEERGCGAEVGRSGRFGLELGSS